MSQNFAATSVYFERRVRKAGSAHLKQQFEAAAMYYRKRAVACGQSGSDVVVPSANGTIPPRRQRLMELFRAYDNRAN